MPDLPVDQPPNAAPVRAHDPEGVAPVPAIEIRDLSPIGGERQVVPQTLTGKEETRLSSLRVDDVHVPVNKAT
jgi:hypothetical protein